MPLFSWRKDEELPTEATNNDNRKAHESTEQPLAYDLDNKNNNTDNYSHATMSPLPPIEMHASHPHTEMTNDDDVDDGVSETIQTPMTAHHYQYHQAVEHGLDSNNTFQINVPASLDQWEYGEGEHTTEYNNDNHNTAEDDINDPYWSSPAYVDHHSHQVVPVSEKDTVLPSAEHFTAMIDYNPQQQHAEEEQGETFSNNALVAVNTPDNQAMVVHVSSALSPRLFCIQPSVQEELDKAQEESLRRKQQLHSRIHQVELRVASIYAALAKQECQDETIKVKAQLNNQLQDLLDRLGLEREALKYSRTTWMQLESKVSQLDAKMTRSTQVQLHDAIKNKLAPGLVSDQKEAAAAAPSGNNRNLYATLAGRLENLAGTCARRYQEERASRAVAVELAGQRMTKLEGLDPAVAQGLVQQIRDMRTKLQQEREERKRADKELLEKIVRKTTAMKRAIMEIVKEEGEEDLPLLLMASTSPQIVNSVSSSGDRESQEARIVQYKTPS